VLDRQDIDALLVGALYGELSSADEAALTTHLDSHPGDRTALDDLKSVRAKFKTSRIFEIQLEPPQAVSAMLLQEAARRAPKIERQPKTDSWFERFISTFVKHPAMAAAATLVLVVGVAGTVFLKNNTKAEQTASQSRDESEKLAAPAPAVAWGSASIGVNKNEDITVGLEDGKQQLAEQQDQTRATDRVEGEKFKGAVAEKPHASAAPSTPNEHRRAGDLAFEDGETEEKTNAPRAQSKAPAKEDYVAIGKDERQPKDLGADKSGEGPARSSAGEGRARSNAAGGATVNDRSDPSAGAPGGAATGTTQSLDGPSQPPAQHTSAKPTPAPVAVAASPPPPPASTPATVAKAEAKPDAPKPDANLAWAKNEHARVTAFVKDGNCKDAAPLALAIRNRAPDYYNSTFVTDRALKPCMQYIADTTEQREKAAAPKASRATDTR
jgi:hypothetical protein